VRPSTRTRTLSSRLNPNDDQLAASRQYARGPRGSESRVHTVASVLTQLLVALLENAGRRSAEAAREKLNVIAEALAPLMASRAVEDHNLDEAVTRLRDAVGLEERH
jgi:hypothetical protein